MNYDKKFSFFLSCFPSLHGRLICLQSCENFAVTTTSQAVEALKMLRESKNKFDLVISDVHMPDMDGFKLLELVGLEMDLPVISKLFSLLLLILFFFFLVTMDL